MQRSGTKATTLNFAFRASLFSSSKALGLALSMYYKRHITTMKNFGPAWYYGSLAERFLDKFSCVSPAPKTIEEDNPGQDDLSLSYRVKRSTKLMKTTAKHLIKPKKKRFRHSPDQDNKLTRNRSVDTAATVSSSATTRISNRSPRNAPTDQYPESLQTRDVGFEDLSGMEPTDRRSPKISRSASRAPNFRFSPMARLRARNPRGKNVGKHAGPRTGIVQSGQRCSAKRCSDTARTPNYDPATIVASSRLRRRLRARTFFERSPRKLKDPAAGVQALVQNCYPITWTTYEDRCPNCGGRPAAVPSFTHALRQTTNTSIRQNLGRGHLPGFEGTVPPCCSPISCPNVTPTPNRSPSLNMERRSSGGLVSSSNDWGESMSREKVLSVGERRAQQLIVVENANDGWEDEFELRPLPSALRRQQKPAGEDGCVNYRSRYGLLRRPQNTGFRCKGRNERGTAAA
jgi:hypothetical protein